MQNISDVDSYKTVIHTTLSEIKIQGSKFIGIIRHCESIDEFEEWIESIRKEYHDATHRCYAFRIGVENLRCRFNDDGEPNGTAGKRILAALEGHSLINVGLIVVRYFGGTKLGVGGLSHAYSDAAQSVISKAKPITKHITIQCKILFPMNAIRDIHYLIDTYEAEIQSQEYTDEYTYTISIHRSGFNEFKESAIQATKGKAKINYVGRIDSPK